MQIDSLSITVVCTPVVKLDRVIYLRISSWSIATILTRTTIPYFLSGSDRYQRGWNINLQHYMSLGLWYRT